MATSGVRSTLMIRGAAVRLGAIRVLAPSGPSSGSGPFIGVKGVELDGESWERAVFIETDREGVLGDAADGDLPSPTERLDWDGVMSRGAVGEREAAMLELGADFMGVVLAPAVDVEALLVIESVRRREGKELVDGEVKVL